MLYTHSWLTPLGVAVARCNDKGLIYLMISDEKAEESEFTHSILKQAQQELSEYFEKKRTQFNVPMAPEGTDFQRQVWKALCHIPYGKTCNYQSIAEKVCGKNASRAVGSACRANPILIMIPCHRVIQKSGKIGHFSAGLNIKVELLKLEGFLKQHLKPAGWL